MSAEVQVEAAAPAPAVAVETVESTETTETTSKVTEEPTVTSQTTSQTTSSESSDVRRSRVGFTSQFAEDVPPLKPLKFTHISPAVAGRIHRTKNYTDALVCDQKIAMEQLRHIRRKLEREDRELRRIQMEFEQYRTPRKWSSTYY